MSEGPDREKRTSRTRLILAAILAMLVLLLGVLAWFIGLVIKPEGAPKEASLPKGLSWVRSIYGYGTRQDQQFLGVQHAAIAPDGTIWATDSPHHRVLGFNPDGTLRATLTSRSLDQPGGITVSADNEIYVADFQGLMIQVFSPSGTLLRAWHTQSNPFQVAVKGDRVAVTCADGIRIFDTKGKLVAKWASRGRKLDQVDLAQGIVFGDDGTIYVADTHNAKIKAFTQSGKLLWTGPEGSAVATGSKEPTAAPDGGELPLQLPSGLTWDGKGHLVFVDPFSFQIMVADPKQKARIIGRYGDAGTTDGFFMYPSGIAYDPARDWFAVADCMNNRLQIVRPPGTGGLDPLAALRRTGVPLAVCGIPLGLLLLALLVALSGRRRGERPQPTVSAADEL